MIWRGAAPGGAQDEEAAKRAWLKKLDVPTWAEAAAELSKVAAEAARMATLEEQCDAGDAAACPQLSAGEAAWLARMEAPPWGKPPPLGQAPANEVPVWGQAAMALSRAAADAAKMAGKTERESLTEQCDAGDDSACDLLRRGDEATTQEGIWRDL